MRRDLSQSSDGELAALAGSGGDDAYRELLARHKGPVFRLIRGHVDDTGEAMDLTQETFVAGFAALARYDRARPFRIWILRIALNKCRDWARRRAVRSFFTRALPLDTAHAVSADAPDPETAAANREELARVRTAMAALPHKLREVLILRGVEEWSQSEVAEILRVSEKTVETRLYRARAKLRVLLGGEAD